MNTLRRDFSFFPNGLSASTFHRLCGMSVRQSASDSLIYTTAKRISGNLYI